jgi:aspartyl-tRNA(Asn)/glutamyl-tRNA(Gln) amidotransferase subunit B
LTSFAGLSLPEKRQVYQAHPSHQDKLLTFLIGQVMQRTQGRANPQMVRTLLRERLEEPRVR